MTDHITLPRSVVEQITEAVDEAQSYTASTTWSPSMTEELKKLHGILRAALAGAAQADPVQLPPWLSYNPEQDVLTINGKRYSPALFGVDGFAAPAGTCLRIVEGPDDVVTCETISAAAPQPTQPVAVPYFNRREVEYAIHCAENPTGMCLNDSKERVILPGGTLRRMLQIIDMLNAAPTPPTKETP